MKNLQHFVMFEDFTKIAAAFGLVQLAEFPDITSSLNP